ncbi:hypothetical protein [Hyphococcus sp.]|jgi:hypothetical protein|uniref:hypothetical protein n=1 Tax=Hyphococcus sp. TaxID=2038636 RepID=UPI003D0F7769
MVLSAFETWVSRVCFRSSRTPRDRLDGFAKSGFHLSYLLKLSYCVRVIDKPAIDLIKAIRR